MDIRFLARAVALAGTVVAVSVCGEQGTFGGTTGPTGTGADNTPPRIVIALGPTDTLVELTDSLKFTVTVTDSARVKSVHVAVSGLGTFAFTPDPHDTSFAVTNVTSYSKAYTYELPAAAAGQRIAIYVSAEDGSQNVSDLTTNVRVNDAVAPTVTMVTPSAMVYIGAGDTIKVLARAVDPSGIGIMGARLFVRDTVLQSIVRLSQDSLVYTSRATLRLDSFRVAVPASLQPGAYLLHVFAVDSSPAGNAGLSAEQTVNVRDVRAPTGTFVGPAVDSQVVAGDSVLVQFRAQDLTGVTGITFRGYSLRGNPLLGTDTTVLRYQQRSATISPARTDTTVTRWIRAVLTDSTAETVYLEAAVTDIGGNVARITSTIQVVAGPHVQVNAPLAGALAPVGVPLTVIVQSRSPYGLDSVGFRSGGAVTGRVVVAKAGAPVNSTDTLTLTVPATAALTNDTIVPLAYHRGTLSFAGQPVVVRFVDASAPTVTLIGPTLVDTAVSAGDSILVHFRLQDNRGVTSATVEGFAARGDSLLGTYTEVARFTAPGVTLNSMTDTTVRRYLKPNTDRTAEPVYVRVTARDAAGNATAVMRRVQIVAGASVRLLSPAVDTSHAVGNPLAVTVSGFDPDSIQVLGFASSGAIARRDSTIFVSPLGTSRTASLSLTVPGTATLGADTLIPFVIDRLGNRVVGLPVVVTFRDATPPTLTFTSPSVDTGVVSGDSVRVGIRVRDNAPATSVSILGRSVRTVSGQQVTVTRFATVSIPGLNSVDTTVARYLPAILTDSTGEIVYLVATATDGVGNATTDSIRIQVTSGPFVRISEPANGAQIPLGQTGARILPVVSAFHPDTITYLGFSATGRVTKTDSVATTRPLISTYIAQQLDLLIADTTRLGTVTLTPFVRTRSLRFTGPAVSVELVDGSLPIVRILSPARAGTDQIPAGDSLFVRVAASDDRELASLELTGYARRPDVAPDTLGQVTPVQRFVTKTVDLSNSVRDTVVRYLLPVPTDSTAENAYIIATATDAAGNEAVDTVRVQVVAGPQVSVTAPTASAIVPVGTTLNVTVTASDPHSLTYVGYTGTGAVARADSVAVAATSATQTLAWAVPATAGLGAETITPFARNAVGARFTGAGVLVTLADTVKPTTTLLLPATAGTQVVAGDSVLFRVRVQDNRGVAGVVLQGRSHRGVDSLGTGATVQRFQADTIVLGQKADTTFSRYLRPVLTDSTIETVYLLSTVEDAAGNVRSDSIAVSITRGPSVRVTSPASGAVSPIGVPLAVSVRGYDPDSVAYVGIIAAGVIAVTDSVALTLDTAGTGVVTLTTTTATPIGAETITPFARDKLGNRFLGGPISVILADTVGPTVVIDSPSVVDMPVTSSDSVFVQVHATDNRGVTEVVLTGVARRGDVSLGTDTTVTRYFSKTVSLSPKADTTITRYLMPVPTEARSELVYIIATVRDSSGNTAADTTTVRIVGGPVMTVVRPVTGAATSVGKSVIIEVRGVDPNGTRLIGWRATGVVTAQDSALFTPVSGELADTAVFIDTLLVPVATALGTFTITPFGLDSIGDVSGTTPGVVVTVESSAGDVTAPSVRFSLDRRVEIDDSVRVTATDAGGLKRLGFRATLLDTTVVVGADSTAPDLDGSLSDASQTFALSLPISLRYPGQVIIRGFAVDASGNRAVSSVADTVTVVAGRTYNLPAGSQIADAIYNQRRRELYLSNFARDRIEVFSLQSNSFVASIPVGSRPWGLALWPGKHDTATAVTTDTIYADTLIVANSGGTNLSIVDLVSRVEVRRHALPNYRIEAIKTENSGAGGVTVRIIPYDLSDRPQYVAAVCRGAGAGAASCDSVVAIYSTTPTVGQSAPTENRGYLAWENISDTGAGNGHMFWEHAVSGAPGSDTTQIIAVRPTSRDTIVGGAAGVRMNLDLLTFQDTTYVRNSGNFLRAVIGEGGGGLTLARVMTYNTGGGLDTLHGLTSQIVTGLYMDSTATVDLGISTGINVQDFIGNRASKVTAVAANFSGTTNLVRADSIYVFNTSLRQTGMLQVSGAAHGMDVAPLHAFSADARGTNTVPADGDADARIVFAARPDSSIDVFDTYFFGRVTDTAVATVPIPIRNALVGSVRVTPDSGGTVLTGITNQGLVVVRLPTLTNPFPVAPMPLALPTPVGRPPRARGASPPNE